MRIFTHKYHKAYDGGTSTWRLFIMLGILIIPIFFAANIETFGLYSLIWIIALGVIFTDRWFYIEGSK